MSAPAANNRAIHRSKAAARGLATEPTLLTALEPLLAQLAELVADALAPRLRAELAASHYSAANAAPTRRLLTLDELVAQLPAGKKPATWRRWLYERSRNGQIPGQHKIGGRLFYDPEHTLPWLLPPGTGSSRR